MGEGFRELGMPTSLNFYCPKCGSRDVVVEIEEKYCKFYRCNSCGFINERIKKKE